MAICSNSQQIAYSFIEFCGGLPSLNEFLSLSLSSANGNGMSPGGAMVKIAHRVRSSSNPSSVPPEKDMTVHFHKDYSLWGTSTLFSSIPVSWNLRKSNGFSVLVDAMVNVLGC